MLVTSDNIDEVLGWLDEFSTLACDTETTGLRPYHGDRLFAVIFAGGRQEYYFNFNPLAGGLGEREKASLARFFLSTRRRFVFHNAKFDMHFLAQFGFEFHHESEFYDTMVMARLVNSDMFSYSLDACAKHFLKSEKSDAVMAYIKEHQLWDIFETGEKCLRFDKVPLDVIVPYALKDAQLTWKLYFEFMRQFSYIETRKLPNWPSLNKVLENEVKLTKICFEMERQGIKVDIPYCKKALAHEKGRNFQAAQTFHKETGEAYKASSKVFERTLDINRDTHPRTAKGNLRFDGKTMGRIEGEAAKSVLESKDAKSRMDFLHGFIRNADADFCIHTNLRQAGTKTGRFSSSEPNLQNLTRPDDGDDEELYPIRRAIVPDSPNHCLVMIDYSQMEYRIMLDYAVETDLIEAIKNGADVHQATADRVGIGRYHAKTLNFAIIFGAGAEKIAEMLGMTTTQAKMLLREYFSKLPRIEALISQVRELAKEKGMIFNWFGRRMHYPNRRFAYKAVNHLIQGGAADVAKLAMVGCHRLLIGSKSRLALVVHDEFIFNIHRNDLHLVGELHRIIETVYPHMHLPLTATISHSWKSLADKVNGPPLATALRLVEAQSPQAAKA